MTLWKRTAAAVMLVLGMVAGAAPVASGAPAGAAAAQTVRHMKAFTLPSGNIACLYDSGRLRCDILSGVKPEPQKACQYFWKGVMLSGDGKTQWLCIIDTVYDASAPTFHHGWTWQRGAITCRSPERGLRCENDLGHGFSLLRSHSTKW